MKQDKKTITEDQIRRALEVFSRRGGLIRTLPPQIAPERKLVGAQHGAYEIGLECRHLVEQLKILLVKIERTTSLLIRRGLVEIRYRQEQRAVGIDDRCSVSPNYGNRQNVRDGRRKLHNHCRIRTAVEHERGRESLVLVIAENVEPVPQGHRGLHIPGVR